MTPRHRRRRGEVIPDGTYAKTVTVADAKALGITDEEFLRNNFGEDGTTTFTYKFAGRQVDRSS